MHVYTCVSPCTYLWTWAALCASTHVCLSVACAILHVPVGADVNLSVNMSFCVALRVCV